MVTTTDLDDTSRSVLGRLRELKDDEKKILHELKTKEEIQTVSSVRQRDMETERIKGRDREIERQSDKETARQRLTSVPLKYRRRDSTHDSVQSHTADSSQQAP